MMQGHICIPMSFLQLMPLFLEDDFLNRPENVSMCGAFSTGMLKHRMNMYLYSLENKGFVWVEKLFSTFCIVVTQAWSSCARVTSLRGFRTQHS
jgi:hypothetical protein